MGWAVPRSARTARPAPSGPGWARRPSAWSSRLPRGLDAAGRRRLRPRRGDEDQTPTPSWSPTARRSRWWTCGSCSTLTVAHRSLLTVVVGADPAGRLRPSGVYVFDRKAFPFIPEDGFQDIKEKLHPEALRGGRGRDDRSWRPGWPPRVFNAETYLALNHWALERAAQPREPGLPDRGRGERPQQRHRGPDRAAPGPHSPRPARTGRERGRPSSGP